MNNPHLKRGVQHQLHNELKLDSITQKIQELPIEKKAKRKRVINPNLVSKRDCKLQFCTRIKDNQKFHDRACKANTKNRALSKKHERKEFLTRVPDLDIVAKNTSRAVTQRNSSIEKSNPRLTKLVQNQEAIVGSWTQNTNINTISNSNIKKLGEKLTACKLPSKIPRITRPSNNTNTYSSKTKRRESGSMENKFIPVHFERSNTQEKLNQNLFSPSTRMVNGDNNSEQNFNESLAEANNEISILRNELKKKNDELVKLKKLTKIKDYPKAPVYQTDNNKIIKGFSAKEKRRARSRLTKVNGEYNKATFDEPILQSDEYYETTKVSPKSSYNNNIYSKGIPKIKSSQSCRNIEQENVTPSLHNQMNLCAVKESEEEQMADTFTKLNLKLSQPTQKELKNSPKKNSKFQNNIAKNVSKKSQLNLQINTNHKQSTKADSETENIEVITLNKNEDTSNRPKLNLNINLPNIKRKGQIKFDHNLIGFHPKSLSNKGALQIQRSKLKLKAKESTKETVNSSQKNNLIDIPKKYKYRRKRLDNDIQSIANSGGAQFQKNTLNCPPTFHTKSGPIQSNEMLQPKTNQNKHLTHNGKLKVMDYRLKGVSSPINTNKNSPSIGFGKITSAMQESASRILTSRQASSRCSLKPIEKTVPKKALKISKTSIKLAKSTSSTKLVDNKAIKTRLQLINFEDEDDQIDHDRELKRKEAKVILDISAFSTSQENYTEDKKESSFTQENANNKFLSTDNKLQKSILLNKALNSNKIETDDEEAQQYMLCQPTHYMLDHPMYQEAQTDEHKDYDKHDKRSLEHCFMSKKDRMRQAKTKIVNDADDICNLQDSQSEVSLNETLEFQPANHAGEPL
ncbi:unnamed protein product [Moneuplotes crassus]|uniref:Uncharacterized protein n=1 Tax=Euplotes crassus TaxID=5936 RepID=A0AAD1XW62_EUPCR|nr:unnamed protein product [Moneuplotes crassus]